MTTHEDGDRHRAKNGITNTLSRAVSVTFLICSLAFGQPIEIEIVKKVTPIKSKGMIQVTLFHTNDIHGHVWPYSEENNPGIGGLAELYSLIRPYHSRTQIFEDEIVLLLDGGDFSMGTPANDSLNGSPVVTAMNAMGYTAAALGISELDRGIDFFERQQTERHFPVLSANVFKDQNLLTTPYLITTIRKVRIGIVGLTTPNVSQHFQHPSTGQLRVEDPIKTAQAIEEKIHSQVDLLIALTHLGTHENENPEADIALAKATKYFHVIVGGGSHAILQEPLRVNNKIILQAGSGSKYLGALVLILDPKKNNEIHHYNYKLLPINLKTPLPSSKNSKRASKKFIHLWKQLYPDPYVQHMLNSAWQSFNTMLRQSAAKPSKK